MIPRIRGKVGQATEPEDVKGKWYFNLEITTLGGSESSTMGPIGPYDTEAQAKKGLELAAKIACDVAEEAITGKASGEYIDLKTNERRRWDKRDEH